MLELSRCRADGGDVSLIDQQHAIIEALEVCRVEFRVAYAMGYFAAMCGNHLGLRSADVTRSQLPR